MKKSHITMIALLAVSMIILITGPVMATVVESPHDFSSGGTSGFRTLEDEVCIFCHTPHGGVASVGGDNVPLWNRTLNLNETFDMYTSQTFDGTYTGGKPTGMSLLCLSCHDGVSSINEVLNYSLDTGAIQMDLGSVPRIGDITYPSYRDPNIGRNGRDLRNDHPVSFVYDGNLVSDDTLSRGGIPGLNDPTTVTAPAIWNAPLILYNNRLECSTCHDPHEFGDPDKMPFLRMSNAGSAMCRTCHIK